tara:strand:- start:161 stop:514 length:354 start_codon:yes stop_codon:yes gene_type:complete
MWQEILKQKADLAGFFRDFEKNKIAELAKDSERGWLNIDKVGKEYGLSGAVISLIYRTNNPLWQKEQPDRVPIAIVDIPSYNKAVRKEIEYNQKLKMKREAKKFKTHRRKGQRKRRR